MQLPALIRRQRQQRLKRLHAEITQLDAEIHSLIPSDEFLNNQAKLLCSIPGMAKLTAAKLLAELAGKDFHCARQLAACAGLTPAEYRSGLSCDGKTRLSKIGNAFLRKAPFMPAAVARRWCPPIRSWLRSLENKKTPPPRYPRRP
jgi:transposase